jgi:hypothetical protein
MCKFFTTFAPKIHSVMKNRLFIIALLSLLSFTCAHAETIILRTGARVKGQIVFQNEEVVIVRDAEGARSQYPRADVQEILADDVALPESQAETVSEEPEIKTSKKASILLELAGGAAVRPQEAFGGAFSVDLLAGTHHIKSRHLFVGGGLGYHGIFLGAEKYNFLPIQAAVRMPFTEQKHAPVFGVAVGYGIALSKTYLGGLYAGADFGYRCQLNPKTAISLVAFAQFQQATVPVTTTLDGIDYTTNKGRNLVVSGLKMALYF